MDQTVLNFIGAIEGKPLHTSACVCHACYKQASRNVGEENYYPRWKPKVSVLKECGVSNCTDVVYRHTTIATLDQVERVLQVNVSCKETESTPLCKTHYMSVYSSLHAPRLCDSCKSKPKRGEQHYRHCPSPDIINSFLSVVGNEVPMNKLQATSIICLNCYKLFNSVRARYHHTKAVIEEISTAAEINLTAQITTLLTQIDNIKSKETITEEEYFEMTCCYIIQDIATALSRNEAMLLPVIYRKFCELAHKEAATYHQNPIETPSIIWFISKLHHYLGEDVVMECKHRKFGTLLYHKNCDLVSALSRALGQQKVVRHEYPIPPTPVPEHNPTPTEKQIEAVALHMNTKLHEQSKVIAREFTEPECYEKMSILTIMKNMTYY